MPEKPDHPAPPLRILHLNSRLTGGGTDDQCVKLAAGLRALGQDVHVAGPAGREFGKVIEAGRVTFHATPPEGPLKLRFILNVAGLLRREKIQIVHGHHGRDLWPTVLAARLSGVKPRIVVTRHMAKSPRSWFSRSYLLSQCDAVIAVSDFSARVMREGVYEPDSPEPERRARPPMRGDHAKIHVIHGGVDTDRFHPFAAETRRREWGLAPEYYVFAVAGGYDLPRGKGQREFLAAAARIHEQVPHARFLIIGRGNMADILRADIGRLGLTGKAWLTPYCQEMPEAMNAIDCLVHCQTGTEAFGLVLLEAFACGRPVIASALDGIPEAFAVGGQGRLIKPGSVTELADAMRDQAARGPGSTAERAVLHQNVAAEHSLPAFAGRVLRFYQSLPAANR